MSLQKQMLKRLFESRLIGEHESKYALTTVDVDQSHFERQKIYGEECFAPRMAGFYTVVLQPLETHPYITNGKERAKSINEGVLTWGASGYNPVLIFANGRRMVATLYRDANSPGRWADHYTTPSGISHQVNGVAETLGETARREFEEELIFLDKKIMQERHWNCLKELKITDYAIHDWQTQILVEQNRRIIDSTYPFAVG